MRVTPTAPAAAALNLVKNTNREERKVEKEKALKNEVIGSLKVDDTFI
jgi:hypothetical protein